MMKRILTIASAVLFAASMLLISCEPVEEISKPNEPILDWNMMVGVDGNTVNLSWEGIQEITGLTWNISNASGSVFTSTEKKVSALVKKAGEYDVTLTLANEAGESSASTKVTIVKDYVEILPGDDKEPLSVKTAVTFFADGFMNQYASDGTAEGDCLVTGDGKYKVSFATANPAGETMVLVIDLLDGETQFGKDTKVNVTRIVVDGKPIDFDPTKILVGPGLGGDMQPANSIRIEILDTVGGSTGNNPPVNPADLAGQNFEIYFTVKGSGVSAPAAPTTKSLITFFNAGWMPAYDGSGDGECEISGDGTYTASFELEGATEAFVLTLDILDAKTIYKEKMNVTIDKILLDGKTEVAFDDSKMNKGFGLNPMNPEDQSYRVSIYDAAGGEVPDPAVNPADFAFSKCEITFFVEGTGF